MFTAYIMPSQPTAFPRQIHDLARRLSDTALSVPGVAKVSLSGQVQEAVYLEFDHQALVRLGIPLNAVIDRLNREISAGLRPPSILKIAGRPSISAILFARLNPSRRFALAFPVA